MKFESPNTPPSEEDYSRFYSSDPYEVLGISKTASGDDMSDARKELLRKFHPDVNDNPRATEIFQNINQAYNKLLSKNTSNIVKSSSPKQSPHKQPEQKQYMEPSDFKERKEETPMEVIEKKLFFNLTLGPYYFVRWVSEAKMVGVTSEKIEELIKSEEAQKVLKNEFMSEVRIWGGDNPSHCIKYVEEWKKVGIELNAYFKLPEVKKLLTDQAIGVKIKIWGNENPDRFLDFVESWKRVDIDLSKIAESPEVIEYLTDQVINVKIKIWGTQSPKEFLSFVREWKKAGINLEEVVNSPKARQALTEIAFQTLKFRPEDFKSFVQKWTKAGWKPDESVSSKIV